MGLDRKFNAHATPKSMNKPGAKKSAKETTARPAARRASVTGPLAKERVDAILKGLDEAYPEGGVRAEPSVRRGSCWWRRFFRRSARTCA